MADAPEWPAYDIGPRDSIFALGAVSVNYARLEFAVYGMFSTIVGISTAVSARLMFKISPEMRDRMMREMLPTQNWPPNIADLAQHFIEAHKICYENRNKLMHSAVNTGHRSAIILYKTGRDGKTTLANPLLNELRQVADDMDVFFDYGLQLSNMINFDLLGIKPKAGDAWYKSWPEKPTLPISLEYTSGPLPIRAQV
jgi:hypothetical protein